MSKLTHITFNAGGLTRNEELDGRSYLVVPMVMIKEGVLNGSNGPLYYPADELSKTPVVWNCKPVVVYHPEINGQGVSACTPDILSSHQIGMIMNTVWEPEENKLKAEAWLDTEKIKQVDNRILYALAKNEVMELSTGLFCENEEVQGTFGDKEYGGIARNYRPDHLAILPDQIGACSVEAGAGFNRNSDHGSEKKGMFQALRNFFTNEEMSHDSLRSSLLKAVESRYEDTTKGKWVYIEDIFNTYFVASLDNKLYKFNYQVTEEGEVRVEDEKQEVKRLVVYEPFTSTPSATEDDTKAVENQNKTGEDMKELVDAIIANEGNSWEESDRVFLMSCNESQLGKLKTAALEQEQEQEPVKEVVENKEVEMTEQEWLDKAPAGIRQVLSAVLNKEASVKDTLIASITANTANPFTKEQLEQMDTTTLEGIASLAKPTGNTDFSGLGDAMVVGNQDTSEEPLVMPSINDVK